MGERSVGCPPYKSTCGIFYLTDINMWYQVYLMNKHQEFLKFEAVLAHCEKRVPEGSLFAAMEYGREMQFFDGHNSLSASEERDQPNWFDNNLSSRQNKHVCSDAQACGRVADVDSQIKNPIAIMYVV